MSTTALYDSSVQQHRTVVGGFLPATKRSGAVSYKSCIHSPITGSSIASVPIAAYPASVPDTA
eukprot:524690-Rhodomonas_salina.1